ncbi:MmcQ/YjbR family DNA-binding protein [Peteryoungia desertarenae]|uniref:MmcQ/YjbR family DNA-binding protein n=1 Tax=Peteryoungia desertarenae TaxID=1813451 RepID=A0ABX6QLM9_9HYPH|nr:MmcQ/YjbR family DNA-binding protein [Peteryoungia desertarenae]QLF69172.1 MmcQ/YjbR family DNA-binding protein [Peteryoungia desertarenae]
MSNLFERAEFEDFVARLPGVSFVDQWDSRVAKVADKVFALLTDTSHRITFKVTEESFEILSSMDGVSQAPYFAKRKWVSVSAEAPLSSDDLQYYLQRSHRLVAQGLTQKTRTELGIPKGLD